MRASRVARLCASVVLGLVVTACLGTAAMGASSTAAGPGRSPAPAVAVAQTPTMTPTLSATPGPTIAPPSRVPAANPKSTSARRAVCLPPGWNPPPAWPGCRSKARSAATAPSTVTSPVAATVGTAIQGTVTGTGGTPLADIEVDVTGAGDWGYEGATGTAADGTYLVHVPPGSYTLYFFDGSSAYLSGYYYSSGSGHFSVNEASPVKVTTTDVTGINVQLGIGHFVKGTVTGTGGTPLADVEVDVSSVSDSGYDGSTWTASDGTYSVDVPRGSYTVYFYDWMDTYLNGYYSSGGFTLDEDSATPVKVTTSDVTGIDVQLETGQFITGTVTGTGGTPLEDVDVEADSMSYLASGETDSDGSYWLLVPPDTYELYFSDGSGLYLSGYYSSSASGHFTVDEGSATPVTVTTSDVTGINVRLGTAHFIMGTVTGTDGTPLSDFEVDAYTAGYAYDGSTTTASDGTYSIDVPAGSYTVYFYDGSGTYFSGYYSSSGFTLDEDSATPVKVTTSDVSGIDVQIGEQYGLAQLILTPVNATMTASGSQSYTAEGYDVYGDDLGDMTPDTTFSISGDGSCTGAYKETAVWVVSCTSTVAGVHTITGTDGAAQGKATLHVSSAPATNLVVAGLPSPCSGGVARSLTVTAKDPYGNSATSYRGTVHLSSTDPAAVLPADYTFTAADKGVHTFGVTLKTNGPQSVTATDIAVTSITGSQTNVLVTGSASSYTPISPRRVLDSRPTGSGHTNIGLAGKFTAGTVRKFTVAGAEYVGGGSAAAIPTNAVAVTGNLTVVGETAPGVIDLGPTVTATGSTATLDFAKGDIRANNVTIGLAPDGSLEAVYRSSTAAATSDLIFDVTGYFVPGSGGATYHSLAPGRVLDTRPSGGGVTHIGGLSKLSNRTVKSFPVAGVKALGWSSALVPSSATGVTGNLTVTGATSAGFVSLGPTMTASPSTSSVNVTAGSTVANGVTVALKCGKLAVVWCGTAGSSANVIFDVTGYFTAGSGGLSYYAIAPVRILDSSKSIGLSGTFASGTARLFTIGGTAGVPTGAAGISGNLTVLSPSSAGWALVSPEIVATPTTSTLNVASGHSEANGFDVALGASGHVALEWAGTTGSSANIALDVTGYWK